MKKSVAILFGLNDYAFEIQKNIASEYDSIHLLSLGSDGEDHFDLSDNWDHLRNRFDMQNCTAFCILEDIAENIFLTISLRDTFPELDIISLSQDVESTNKLILAGATKVLPTMETTANIIVDILQKPVVTEVLHNILYEKSDLKIAQIKIEDNTEFIDADGQGRYLNDIEWSREYGIIVISVVHEDNSREFIYSAKANKHRIQNGDLFVVVGYDADIQKFEKNIGKSPNE